MRAGLTTRVLLVAGVLAMVIAAAFVSLMLAMGDASRARGAVEHNQREIVLARDVRNSLIDMETGSPGQL